MTPSWISLLLGSAVIAATVHAAEPAPPPKPKREPAPGPGPSEPAKPSPKPEPDPHPEPKPQPPMPPKPTTPPIQVVVPPAAPEAKKPDTATASTVKKKTVAEVIKGLEKLPGLFEFYVDKEKGSTFLFVKREQLGPEFIYFNHTVDGTVQAGHYRGRYGDECVFKIGRSFDRLEFIKENTSYYFDPTNPLARAANANTSHAILASETIVASDERGCLIAAGPLFLKESLLMVKAPATDQNKAVLGKLSDTKTKFVRIDGYPDNTAVTVEYVYENSSPTWNQDNKVDADEITDPRYISVKVQHNFIRMPVNDFKPREDDPRIGYFATQITDLTTTAAAPYRDVIHRWHLVKQKPGTELSEPVQPIVFWIENTTPVELRDTIRSAALRWNDAFTSAGFKDALVIKQQPDNATWNAGDINYNVLRWTSSPNPPFGGYGPSFVNPRTGQILGADIMLEYSYVTNRMRTARLFEELGLASLDDQNGQAILTDEHACIAGVCAQQGLLFGNAALRLRGASAPESKTLLHEALHYLVLHELGHTLGLNHNFRASQLYSPTEIHNRELTEKSGLTGSVMDYPPANIAPEGVKQGQFYTTKPGPYDHWAIEYGYSEALEDPAKEHDRLRQLAARSHQPQLGFANDADDMRKTGKGIDPRAMLYDMSSDPVTYGEQRCALVQQKLKDLLNKQPEPGESWQALTQAFITLTTETSNSLTAISRYVGGVYVERAFAGQAPKVRPYTPVEKDRQQHALSALAKYAFGASAWDLSPDLVAHLQQQRRGFEFNKEDEDPKLHERIAKLQNSLLDHLLSSNVQRRIIDSALYGNEVGLSEVMTSLTQAIYAGDPPSGPNTLRQNLQTEYLDRLLRIANTNSYLPAAQAVAYSQIVAIKAQLATGAFPHKDYLAYKIRRGLDER